LYWVQKEHWDNYVICATVMKYCDQLACLCACLPSGPFTRKQKLIMKNALECTIAKIFLGSSIKAANAGSMSKLDEGGHFGEGVFKLEWTFTSVEV